MKNSTFTHTGTLTFMDGATATTLLEVTARKIRLSTTSKGTTHVKVYDRAHVVGLSGASVRPGQWMPVLTLKLGKEVTLGVIMTEAEAAAMTAAF